MKHVLLALLVCAASTHAAPILADVPGEGPPEEATAEGAIAEEALTASPEIRADESSDVTAEDEAQPIPSPPSSWWHPWVCRARPIWGFGFPVGGFGFIPPIARRNALNNCWMRYHRPCRIVACYPLYGPR